MSKDKKGNKRPTRKGKTKPPKKREYQNGKTKPPRRTNKAPGDCD